MTDAYMLAPGSAADIMPAGSFAPSAPRHNVSAPSYLHRHYWWAYVHPRAVHVFERQWLVNAILWGHYGRLRDAALTQLADRRSGATLQVACAYGDLTTRLAASVATAGGTLDVIDVLPIQLQNLRRKLSHPAKLLVMDSSRLELPDQSYDQVLLFFLLHEQPAAVRRRTLREALRVVRPGGKLIVVDYSRPHCWHPLRYVWRMVLAALEPFALDLWRQDVTAWMPHDHPRPAQSRSFFGGLYQMTTFIR
ncbi:MAG TPA: rhodoquinone biosynthesis methyltransferase RquA [Pseudolabrys sp.]|nr:rhodoquinone biosynthesis methyltransferase RquA [Pseudolabrys sp.]